VIDSEDRLVNSYLGLTRVETSDPGEETPRIVGHAAVDETLRDPTGAVRAGALVAMNDGVGGFAGGLTVIPDWIVTTNILVRVIEPRPAGHLRLEPEILRSGRNSVVVAVRTFDGTTPIADAIVTSAVLTPKNGPRTFERPIRIEPPRLPEPIAPYDEFFCLEPGPAGSLRMQAAPRLRNLWGIVHGGAVAVLVEATGTRAVAPDATGTDVALHYLSPVRTGPAEARPTVISSHGRETTVRIEVRDLGTDDRLAAIGVVTVRTG
jgi:uncharacterized protein (TIGR00369 family)